MQFLPPTLKRANWEDAIVAGLAGGITSAAAMEYTIFTAFKPDWLAGTPFEHGRAWLYGILNFAGGHSILWQDYLGWMQNIAASGHPYFIPAAQVLTATAFTTGGGWLAWRAGKPRSRILTVEASRVLEGAHAFEASAPSGLNIRAKTGIFQHFKRGFRISEDRARGHWGIFGGTGSGKSVTLWNFLIPVHERGDRLLLVDYKGITEKWLGNLNVDFLILDPSDARSAVWSLAKDVRTKQEARDLAASLIPETKDPSWSNGARAILTALIIKLQQTKGLLWGWDDLSQLCNLKRFAIYNIMLEFLPEAAALLADSKPGDSYMSVFIASAGIISDLAEAWGNRPGLSIKKWMQSPNTKYRTIILKISKFKQLSKAVNTAILNMAANITPDLPDVSAGTAPIWIVADEFPRLGKVEGFDEWISAGRSKDIRVILCCQSRSQLIEIYGENITNSWLDSIETKILGRSDGKGAEWAESIVGEGKYERPTTTQNNGSGNGSTHGWQPYKDPIFSEKRFKNDLGKVRFGKYMRVLVHGFPNVELVLDFPISAVKILPVRRKSVIYADFCLPPRDIRSQINIEKVIADVTTIAFENTSPTDITDAETVTEEQIKIEGQYETQNSFLQNLDTLERIAEGNHSELSGELNDHVAEHDTVQIVDAMFGTDAAHLVEALGHLDELDKATSTLNADGISQLVPSSTTVTEIKKKIVIRRKKSSEIECENSL